MIVLSVSDRRLALLYSHYYIYTLTGKRVNTTTSSDFMGILGKRERPTDVMCPDLWYWGDIESDIIDILYISFRLERRRLVKHTLNDSHVTLLPFTLDID